MLDSLIVIVIATNREEKMRVKYQKFKAPRYGDELQDKWHAQRFGKVKLITSRWVEVNGVEQKVIEEHILGREIAYQLMDKMRDRIEEIN